jgi:hypothetical protein
MSMRYGILIPVLFHQTLEEGLLGSQFVERSSLVVVRAAIIPGREMIAVRDS